MSNRATWDEGHLEASSRRVLISTSSCPCPSANTSDKPWPKLATRTSTAAIVPEAVRPVKVDQQLFDYVFSSIIKLYIYNIILYTNILIVTKIPSWPVATPPPLLPIENAQIRWTGRRCTSFALDSAGSYGRRAGPDSARPTPIGPRVRRASYDFSRSPCRPI